MCLVGALTVFTSGCATDPVNPWADLETDLTPAERPLELPELPEPVSVSEETVTLDRAGASTIREYRIIAEANTGMAEDHAKALDERKRAEAALIEAGQAQRALTDIQKEILAEERRHWWIERAAYWLGFGVIIGVSAL